MPPPVDAPTAQVTRDTAMKHSWLPAALAVAAFITGCTRQPPPPALAPPPEKSLEPATPLELERTVLQKLQTYDVKPTFDENNNVERLQLEGDKVDDGALEDLHQFKMLRRLSLTKSRVTDAGMLKIRALKDLQNLGLVDTLVTDKGLGYLQQNTGLRHVWVTVNNHLTDAGIEALKQAVPELNVHVMNRKKPAPAAPKKAA